MDAAPVYLIGCSDTKRAGPCAASELYTGDLFLKARAYVTRAGAEWFILSAKYGLLAPDAPVECYNLHLKGLSAEPRREWGRRVRQSLAERGLAERHFIAFAGKTYLDAVGLPADQVSRPLAGLGIGYQLAWFREREPKAGAPIDRTPLFGIADA